MAFTNNPKVRDAFFEKLKQSGKLSTTSPRVQTPHPPIARSLGQPPVPQQLSGMPKLPSPTNTGAMTQPNVNPGQVNPNFIGNPKAQRFQKIKKMFGV